MHIKLGLFYLCSHVTNCHVSTHIYDEVRVEDPSAQRDEKDEQPAELGVPAPGAVDERNPGERRRVGKRLDDVHVAHFAQILLFIAIIGF